MQYSGPAYKIFGAGSIPVCLNMYINNKFYYGPCVHVHVHACNKAEDNEKDYI